jgi:hypothetical protein
LLDFHFFIKEGWQHIISWDALDHILFIAALMAAYTATDIKKILILVTAFTIGHSITLALAYYKIIHINPYWVELFIPLTIAVTAIINLLQKANASNSPTLKYIIALLFGCIHGLGFANTIQFMVTKKDAIFLPLLGFNIGVEMGQIVVVFIFLLINYILVKTKIIKQDWWIWTISLTCIFISSSMLLQRL